MILLTISINRYSIKIYEIKLLFNISIIFMSLINIFLVLEIQFVTSFKVPWKVTYFLPFWTSVPFLEFSGKRFVVRYRLCLEMKFGTTVYQDISITSRTISQIRPMEIQIMNAIVVKGKHV